MSIEAPQGILNIPNATLRVGKLVLDNTVGADTVLNTVARNTALLVDSNTYVENKNWDLKLPNAWVGEFECNTYTTADYSEFNFYSEGATSNTQGYNLTFKDTSLELRYDGGSALTTVTIPSISTASLRKIRILFERTTLSVAVDGTNVLSYNDTEGPRARVYNDTTGGFINFFTTGGAIKNVRIVNEKWMTDGTGNINYVGGKVGVGTDSPTVALDVVGDLKVSGNTFYSNNTSIHVDSNVVVEFTGPHARLPKEVPLKKYPEIAFAEGKFDENGLTLLPVQTQAGYTVSASKASTLYKQQWTVFDGLKGAAGANYIWRPYAYNGGTTQIYNTSTGLYDPTAITAASEPVSRLDTNTEQGEWISVEMPKAIKLKHFYLYSQWTSVSNLITSGHLYAKNTSTDSWVKIHSFNDVTTTSIEVPMVHNVNSTTSYKQFALIVTKSTGFPTLGEWELYGYEEDPPLGDTSVDTTFTSIMNTPQTTGANVYVDGSLGETFTNRVVGPTVSNTHTTYVSAEKYWELSGNVESNVTLEANTFLSGDAPHSLSMWFKSSNLVSNASNSCIFSLGTEERLDHVSATFSNNYQTVQKFTAGSRSTTNANFGHSCAINSDGTRMIVGAINEDNPQTNYGAVYIYTYSNGKWDGGVRIAAPTPVSGTDDQGFGRSVDINSAGTRVVVGSWFDDTGAGDSGAAWVYSYSNGSWTLDTVSGVSTGRIQASNKGAGDRFGNSVAMSGDGTRITVGAIHEDTQATSAGSAYIYTYSGGSWGNEKIIQALDASTGGNAEFGWNVAMNNDGTKVVVGAAFHDTGGGDIGAAYVFTYNSSGDSWSQQEKIQSSDKVAGDRFGYSVDINSDGTKIVVGADSQDTGGSAAGAAYVYTYNNGSWYDSGNNEQKIQASDKRLNTSFGTSAAFNTDGTKLIVGARYEDAAATNSGAAYIFAYDGSNWNEVVKLKAYDGVLSDHFGNSVAMSGDGKRVVVGAENDDDHPGSTSGSVYVYDRDTTHHLTTDLKLQSNTWHNLTYAYQGEGGSRVTYLDGRKVAEDQAEDTFGEYPPFAMTGYSQGGYVVSSSREYVNVTSGGTFPSWHCFNKSSSNAGSYIGLDYAYNGTNGIYTANGEPLKNLGTATGSSTTINGEYVIIKMPHKLKLSYVNVKKRGSQATHAPGDGKIYGSNDGTRWVEIASFSGLTYGNTDTSYTPITVNADTAYEMFAFVVSKNAGYSGYSAIGELKYYGHRENDLVRLPDPTNVLKYPHVVMTGPAHRGYMVTASTSDTDVGGNHEGTGVYQPYSVFDDITSTEWLGKANRYDSSGDHIAGQTTIENSNTWTGDWLQIQTPNKIRLTSTKIARQLSDLYGTNRSPRQGAILGSNSGTTWQYIHNWSGIGASDWPSGGVHREFTFTTPSDAYYKYYRFIIEKTQGDGYTSIGSWQLFGTEEASSIPLQIGGGNIDKVANFRVYDKFVGEDQALEIWDAQKDEFGRAKSSMTLQKGRLGIGTTEPQGRLAVLDEPHNLEEFPPRAMTAYETHMDGHGVFCASASSTYGIYYPWKAFDRNITDDTIEQAVWHTLQDFTNTAPGIYNAGASLGGYTGAWLKLKLPYSIKPSKVSIHPRTYSTGSSYNYDQNPVDFLILGSKDDNTWDVLSTQVGVVIGGTWKDFILSPGNNNYKYFAISCTKVKSGEYFAIADMKYFGTREQDQSVLHDGQLTLTNDLRLRGRIFNSGFGLIIPLDNSKNVRVVQAYTGSDVSFTVPSGVTRIYTKMWGAGGSGGFRSGWNYGSPGGAGGFTHGVIATTPGETLTLMIGEGGHRRGFPSGSIYGGGGFRNTNHGNIYGGNGGGRTAIRRGSTELVTAGGGGGGGATRNGESPATSGVPISNGSGNRGGAGGGLHGQNGASAYDGRTSKAGGGGGQSLSDVIEIGANHYGASYGDGYGSQFQGGVSPNFGGSGGGGWYGGGSGGYQEQNTMGGGGGGSGYVGGCLFGQTFTGCLSVPANIEDVDYVTGIGDSGIGFSAYDGTPSDATMPSINGKNGFMVIYY